MAPSSQWPSSVQWTLSVRCCGAWLRRHPLHCPLAFIGGLQSVEARQAGTAATHRVAGELFTLTEGSHLFPMEHPDTTAALVLDTLKRMSRRAVSKVNTAVSGVQAG